MPALFCSLLFINNFRTSRVRSFLIHILSPHPACALCVPQDDAQKAYISLIDELAGAGAETPAAEPGQYKYIESTVTDGLRVIKFNRPAKKNAFLKEVSRVDE